MKNLFELTATEIVNILNEKNIQYEFVIGDYEWRWLGYKTKSGYNWIAFFNENSCVFDAQHYSDKTGKFSRGSVSRSKVFNRFQKLINK